MKYKIYSLVVLAVFCLSNLVACHKGREEINPFQDEWNELLAEYEVSYPNIHLYCGKGYTMNSISVEISIQGGIDECIDESMYILANNEIVLPYVIYGGDLNKTNITHICLYIDLLNENGEVVESTYLYAYYEYGFQIWTKPGIGISGWELGDEGIYDLKDYRTVEPVDSDGDGLSDKYELCFGLDPNNPETTPGHNDAHMVGPAYWPIVMYYQDSIR
ncbi:MAG: thrombospondin type 3 repeat-containing protein [Clostridia bacterium]|nr:thrombospondin type 3 repeat-containing protein [Clostridia bacterium]